MNQQTLDAANEAIFHKQLNTDKAIRYVINAAKVDPKQAGSAIKLVLVGYKKTEIK